jgi:GT2 family glycosyltransferase
VGAGRRLEGGAVTVSLVVVCHRSSTVLGECIASFRAEARAAGVDSEVVAIEQSDDADEAARLGGFSVDRLEVRPNLGYAAGVNAGIDLAGGGTLVLANPDTVLCQGSLAAMLAAIEQGFDVVGPQLVWDDGGELLFPPAEDPAPAAELWRTVRRRWRRPWSAGLASVLESWWRVWTADRPVEVPALRGPMLAVPRSTVERFGRLDEGYFLYYEETEWLWRARRRGARLAVAANARVVHRAGHTADRLEGRAAIEEASRERFFARNYGAAWRWLLRRAAAGRSHTGVRAEVVTGPSEVPARRADLWLLSTFANLMPAVGVVRRSALPRSLERVAAGGPWFAVPASRDSGRWKIDGGWQWTLR